MLNIENFKKVIESCSVDRDNYSVKFTYLPVITNAVKEENGTRFYYLSTQVEVKDKTTGEEETFVADILKVPAYSESGFTIRGKSKQVVSNYTKSYGWYLSDHLKLYPQYGYHLGVIEHNYQLYVTTGDAPKDPKVPLAIFLKALTGNSFSELAERIGMDSIYVMRSFSIPEPVQTECVTQCIKSLLRDYRTGKKDRELELLSAEDRFTILYTTMLDRRGIYLGMSAGVRMRKLFSYRHRAVGMSMAETLSVNGFTFEKGKSLDHKLLEQLDYLPVTELKVTSSEGKTYIMRKDGMHNFPALGYTLEQDVIEEDIKITKGTYLDTTVLRTLDTSSLGSIKVSKDGVETVITRKVFDGSFTISDLIGAVQVLLDSFAGVNLQDNVYGPINQNVVNLDLLAADLIKVNCHTLVSSLMEPTISFVSEKDLMTKILTMTPLKTDGLIEYLESAETVEVQQAELNNTIQKISKEAKLSKQVKVSSPEMTSVQHLQFGMLDAIESPESAKIGTIHSKTYTAGINKDGYLTIALIPVKNGEIVDINPVYLTASEREGEYIAEWNETFHYIDENGVRRKKEKVMCMSSTTFLEVPIEDVRYKQVGPFDNVSYSRMATPYMEHNQLKRLVMNGNHTKQAKTIIKRERSLVSSGGESLLAHHGIVFGEEILKDFYEANITAISESWEDFSKRKLKLISIDPLRNHKVLTFEVEGYSILATKRIPYMQKSASGSLFSYEIQTNTNLVYTKDDVVACNVDVDTKHYERDMRVDFGHMSVDDKVFEQALATSRNLFVAFKTYESSTMDDSILISSDLAYDGLLGSLELSTVEYELADQDFDKETNIVTEETFGVSEFSSATLSIRPDGLPYLNSMLYPGDPVIVYKQERKKLGRAGKVERLTQTPDIIIRLEDSEPGQVVAAYIEGRKATVYLARIKNIEEGDKMTGRHGNKGTVGRIVHPKDMPYDPETGIIYQVCLSPLGIPSRMNIGQLLEAYMGMVMHKEGKVHIVTPFQGNNLETVLARAKEAGVGPKKLRDGRTGKYFKREVFGGKMYILVSEHQVSHKMKYIGMDSPLDPVFGQPSKGKGGQALGEMETWALEAAGARKFLQDAMSIQSDDLDGIRVLNDAILENPYNVNVKGENHNDQIFLVITRCLGSEPYYDKDDNIGFRPLTDNITKSFNAFPVDVSDKKSLGAFHIFGNTSSVVGRFESRDNWSWMPLHCEIVHPTFIIKGTLSKLFTVRRYVMSKGKIQTNKDGIPKRETVFPTLDMLWDLIACKAWINPEDEYIFEPDTSVPGLITGMSAFIELLRKADINQTRAYIADKLARSKTDSTKRGWVKHLRQIDDFIESGITFEDFIITTIPVMPKSFRPDSKFSHVLQDFDFYYANIMDEVLAHQLSNVKKEENVYAIFLRIAEFCGLKHKNYIVSHPKFKPLIKYFTGRESQDKKHGRLRESTVKKRQLLSGRTVIIPSRDMFRPIDKIGIPFEMAITIASLHLKKHLFESFKERYPNLTMKDWEGFIDDIVANKYKFMQSAAANPALDGTDPEDFYDMVRHMAITFLEGATDPETGERILDPVPFISGRQPTLHVFGQRAFEPIIVDGKCIEVHPINNKGQNADHDGDQEYVIMPVNRDSALEALEKLSPKHGVLNPKDRSIILDLTQDMRLGIYFATMLKDNIQTLEEDPKTYEGNMNFYNSLDLLKADVDDDVIQLHDLVCLRHKGNTYMSTAGRILFNACLPDDKGFTDNTFTNPLNIPNVKTECYKDLRFDGLVSGGGGLGKKIKYVSVKKIIMWCLHNYDPDTNLKALANMASFGFKFCDISGVSLALEDLTQNPYTQVLLDRAKVYADKINEAHSLGLLSDEERKNEIITLYQKCKEKVRARVIADFDRNNSLFLMLDSGARGNEDQIMQLCGVIGILQKSKDEVMESPITTNYGLGISDFEMQQISFSTRVAISSTQNETSDSGELTRIAVYTESNDIITEEDCGVEPELVKLDFTEPTGLMKNEKGVTMSPADLVGLHLKEDSKWLKYITKFTDETRVITETALDILLRKTVQHVDCEEGTFSIFYKPDQTQKSQLLYRYTDEDLPYLIDGHYISDETIDYIYKTNKTHIRFRHLFGCKSKVGMCKKCFGLLYQNAKLPDIGMNVGVTAAQSIGEPASQLTMNLVHAAGDADKAVDKGVALYKSTLKRGFPSKLPSALLSDVSGYAYIQDNGKIKVISESGEIKFYKPKQSVKILDGEYVEKFEPMTSGVIMPSEPVSTPTLEEIRFKQMSLLRIHYMIYAQNRIDVLARHFELIVKNQLGFVFVLESEDPEIKVGKLYPVNEVVGNDKVSFIFSAQSNSTIIEQKGGLETSLVHERFAEKLAVAVTEAKKSNVRSFIGKMLVGRNVAEPDTKIFKTRVTSDSFVKTEKSTKEDNTLLSALLSAQFVEEVETPQAVPEEIDWSAILGEDLGSSESFNSNEPEPVAKISLEDDLDFEEEEEEVVTQTPLNKSNSFGG